MAWLLNNDYAILVDVITQGNEAACFVYYSFRDGDTVHRDVAKAEYSELSETYCISVRGFVYAEERTVEDFINECKKLKVEFFLKVNA